MTSAPATTRPPRAYGSSPRAQNIQKLVARRRLRRRTRRGPVLYFAVFWGLLVVIVALTVQWLPVHDPTAIVGLPSTGFNSSKEFLGTDAVGRSTLSRICFGARVSIGISFISTLIAMVVGGLLGLVTAYFGRWVTWVVDVVTTVVLAVPSLLLLLALVLALRPNLVTITGALSLVFVPAFMRLTRANARAQLGRDYVHAAHILNASAARVIFREVVPNIAVPIFSYAAVVLPGIIVTEGALSFLGFGVQPPTPSWGGMIAQAQNNLNIAPAPALIPCGVLLLTVFSLNTIGDYVRQRFDIRDSGI